MASPKLKKLLLKASELFPISCAYIILNSVFIISEVLFRFGMLLYTQNLS